MGWIKKRIDAEYKKYHDKKDMGIDWSEMAEIKIMAEINIVKGAFANKKLVKEVEAWMEEWYEYSSKCRDAKAYNDFSALKRILKKYG